MLVVLGLISDMNDSTQSTIHIPQLYVLHSRAILALRLCMPCAFQNVRFNTGDGGWYLRRYLVRWNRWSLNNDPIHISHGHITFIIHILFIIDDPFIH